MKVGNLGWLSDLIDHLKKQASKLGKLLKLYFCLVSVPFKGGTVGLASDVRHRGLFVTFEVDFVLHW
jgi:hypothetical protein